jgi:hypothetical protein
VETVIIEWDGAEVPEALRKLPPDRYLVEALDEPGTLTEEQESGLMRAMDQLDAGQDRPLEEALSRVRASLARRPIER